MSARRVVGFCATMLAVALDVAVADVSATLRFDPFSRPPVSERVVEGTRSDSPGFERGALDLRGTLIGVRQRYANVGGRILAIGETVDGYTLIAVEENAATFAKDGTRFTAFVKPDAMDANDE